MKLDDKLKKLIIIIMGSIVLIIIIALIINAIKGDTLSYEKIEEKMVSAAKEYINDNEGLKPTSEDDVVTLDDKLLSNSGYMKDISKYTKKSETCSGTVTVKIMGEELTYVPYLNCGESYSSIFLVDKLKENVVTNDEGLYQMNQVFNGQSVNNYVYRGEYLNNYIKFDDKLYRIIKIDSEDNIMITQADSDRKNCYSLSWDDRYNSTAQDNSGINDFYASRIRKTLEEYLSNSNIVVNSLKNNMVSKYVCEGTRKTSDNRNDGSIECSKLSQKKEYLSLITAYDFINASLDSNCKSIEDKSCGNYNYLSNFDKKYWLLTTSGNENFKGFIVDSYANARRLSNTAFARIVINLGSSTMLKSGTGSETDPYIVK